MAGEPAPACIEPLKPVVVFFFKTILIIPAPPCASYLADGLVITSTFSMLLAGICSRPLFMDCMEGLPLINILTALFPLRLITPFASTFTEGTLFKMSLAFPPFDIKSFPTLNTFLSRFSSKLDFSPITLTDFNILMSSFNSIFPKSKSVSINLFSINIGMKEMNSILRWYVPAGTARLNSPFSLAAKLLIVF